LKSSTPFWAFSIPAGETAMEDASPDSNFMDELLAEAQLKENKNLDALMDLVLIEIRKLDEQIARNFRTSDEECKLIQDWALRRSAKLQDRINWLSTKLEAFIRERGCKTIDLPNGVLKIRKAQDRLEIDLEEFLETTDPSLLTLVPAMYKPNLAGIKAMIKEHDVVPDGVTVIEGIDKFSFKLKNQGDTDDGDHEE
jgi:hypothetical protein